MVKGSDRPHALVTPAAHGVEEFNIRDYWTVVWKRRWLVGGLCVAAMVISLVISLQMPKIYEASVTLIPSMEGKEGGGLAGLLSASGAGGAAQSLGITLPGAPATSVDLFISMLKSRVMLEEVIKKFDLQALYKAKTLDDARRALAGDTKISITKERLIQITVEAPDPELAAALANFYAVNLDQLNRTLNVSKASQNRRFIERRLAETKVNLVQMEENLKEFQLKNRAVAPDVQSKAMIDAAAMIQSQIIGQEVQLEVMSGYLAPGNPELARAQATIEELRKQLNTMQSGKSGKSSQSGERLHLAMNKVPNLALEYGRAMRELKVQEALYGMLTSQYEQAKIAEARDTPSIQVLDAAIPPDNKSKPLIRVNVMIAGLLALIVGVLLAFILEAREKRRLETNEVRIEELKEVKTPQIG